MPMIFFEYSEFDCRCGECDCRGEDMDPEFLDMLDRTRDRAGFAFNVSRGVSCPAHNAAVGGSETSSHLPDRACAADIAVMGSSHRFKLIEAAIAAGFRRIGVADTFIHLDSDENKPAEVMWLY